MIIDELFEGPQLCPECGGISFSDLILAEKKDACYYKVKASAKVWPSAYASGRLVQCRKKGAANYGNKSEGVAEGSGQKPTITYKDYTLQYDYQTEDDDPEGYSTATTYYFDVFKDGNRVGEAEYFDYFGDLTIRINGKTKKFEHQHPLASQVSQLVSSLPDEQKRDLSDPKFESQGVAEQQELDEKWSAKYKSSINCANPRGFSQRAHCAGRKKNEDVAELDEGGDVFMPNIKDTAEYKAGLATGKLPVPYPEGTQQYASYYKGVIDRASPTLAKVGEEVEPTDDGAFSTWSGGMRVSGPNAYEKARQLDLDSFAEGEQQKGADYRDPKEVDYDDEYDAMVARVKKLAGLGPMKTVYDPTKRVYRNMPTAVQPKK